MRHLPNVVLMLDRRQRRRANIKTILGKCLVSAENCHFRPLEVVGRGSETQLQVGEKYSQFQIISQ